jgi:hypothetical protein
LICSKGHALFEPRNDWWRRKFEKHVPLCEACWRAVYGPGDRSRPSSAWRGKGSFGRDPSEGLRLSDRDDQ